jgi:hypothetical protein
MIKDVTSIFGYQQIVGLAASTGLTVPVRDTNGLVSTPTVALIVPETQAVRWRDDGTAPTATVGMPLAVGAVLMYDGDLTKIRFFQQAATATLNVSYYK